MKNYFSTLRMNAIVAGVLLSSIVDVASSQVPTLASAARASGRMSTPADLDAFSRDVQSLVGMSQKGNLLYDGDPNKRDWPSYCGASRGGSERGEFRSAVRDASKALHIGSSTGNVNASAFAARDLAIAYSWAGDLERGQLWAERALEFARGMSSAIDVDSQIRYDVLRTMGDVAFRRNQYPLALEKYQEAAKKLPFLGKGLLKETIALAVAHTQSRLGSPQSLVTLAELTKSSDTDVRMMAYRILTLDQLTKGQIDAAKDNATRLSDLASQSKNSYEASWAYYLTARTLSRSGQTEPAIAAAMQAIEKIELVRSGFISKEIKNGLFGNSQEIFEFTVQLLTDHGRWLEAFEISERSRSRTTLDIVRKARPTPIAGQTSSAAGVTTTAAVNPLANASRFNARAFNAKKISSLLPDQTALVTYMVLPDRVVMWTVDQNGVNGASTRIDREALGLKIQEFRTAIEQERIEKTKELGASLYETLVKPLSLTGDQAVVVAPHSMLHFLPFQALRSSKGWWIEERAISYAVSGSSLPEKENSRALNTGLDQVIALGNPDVNNSKLDLPGATTEVENIKTLYPTTKIYTRKEASKDRVVEQAASAGILHIAAHAMVDEIDPLYSYILLSNPRAIAGTAGGELEARDMQSLKLENTKLVTLSACNSGIGKVASGDEFSGFKTAILVAGAPRLMVSLWPVDDDATAALMSSFYQSAATLSTPQAIRKAQLSLINDKNTSSPFFWAPFVLVGDPR